jgi:nucleotide-binding universal stress UspA family protein
MGDPVVLLALDGAEGALAALSVARRLADLEKGSVRILHVTEQVGGGTAAALGLQPADLRGATLEVRDGVAADAILAAAEQDGARLIVMCAPAADVGRDDAVAALAVLRGAHCPVVLIDPTRTPAGWTPTRVLAPHDGSPAVSEALRPSARLAREAGAEFLVLQVATGEERALEAGSMAPPEYVDQVQHSWPVWSGEFLARLASICPLEGLRVHLLVGHGKLAAETVRVANEQSADLILLAWKSPWTAARAATFRALLRDAPCPVIATRVPDRPVHIR